MLDGKFELPDIKVTQLSKVYNLELFDCGDNDLNEFLKKDSFAYQDKDIAKVYLVISSERVIGYFSLQNDAVKLKLSERYLAEIKKPHTEYPAVKIGRLGIGQEFQRKGLGKLIISIAIGLITKVKKYSACRFITVDSYFKSVGFYKKYGFEVNKHEEYASKKHYVSMRLDIFSPKV